MECKDGWCRDDRRACKYRIAKRTRSFPMEMIDVGMDEVVVGGGWWMNLSRNWVVA